MKFENTLRKIESSEPIEDIAISITGNAKAFNLLFKAIYPDIIKAISREYLTNAWDAQKEAGNLNTPIDVHVPTIFEPWFSVRDYGVSMNHEQIKQVFSRVFESTKDDSNEVAGMFGMGSKSALGYTDTFSVQCWLDGHTRIYDVFAGENGTPRIQLKYDDVSTEPNGVLVTIGVDPNDINRFKDEINHVLTGFTTTPINCNDMEYKPRLEVISSTENWEYYKSDMLSGIYVKMGCVLYKIRTNYMGRYVFPYPQNGVYDNLNLILNFPIGTFNITGSREDIIYDDVARSLIMESVRNFFKENYDIAVQKIKENKFKYIFEFVNYVSEFSKKDAKDVFTYAPKEYSLDNIEFKGHKYTFYINHMITIKHTPVNDDIYLMHLVNSRSSNKFQYSNAIYPKILPRDDFWSFSRTENRNAEMYKIVVISRGLKKVNHRAKTLFMNGAIKNWNGIFVTTDLDFTKTYIYKKLYLLFGYTPEIIYLKDVTPFQKPRKAREKKILTQQLLYLDSIRLDSNGYNFYIPAINVLVDQTKPVVYLSTSRGRIKNSHSMDITSPMLRDYQRKITLDQSPDVIYRIHERSVESLKKRYPNVKFINFVDQAYDFYMNYKVDSSTIIRYIMETVGINGPNEYFFKIRYPKELAEFSNGTLDRIDRSYIHLKCDDLDIQGKIKSMTDEINAFHQKYQLLPYLNNIKIQNDNKEQLVLEYIKSMEKV